MHDLEQAARPAIGAMQNDLTIPIDEDTQRIVTAWALKTTMALEFLAPNSRAGAWYFDPAQRHALRVGHTIPDRTQVWTGRCLGLDTPSSYGGSFGPSEALTFGYTMTMTFGALAIHLVNLRSDYAVPSVAGSRWAPALLRVWPITPGVLRWPPPRTFGDANAELPLTGLASRMTGIVPQGW